MKKFTTLFLPGLILILTTQITIKLTSQSFSWNTDHDAAINHHPRGKIYFFKLNQYTRLTDTKVDPNYPTSMPGGWQGLPTSWNSGIDAAVYHGQYNKVYFFKGNQYVRLTDIVVDSGYPRALPGGWQGLPASWHSGIDAALYYEPTGKLYFFKNNQYLRITGTKVDQGYPRALPGGWSGLPASFHSGIDAAVFRNGHTYFFKGDQYVRFTGTKMDNGYPTRLPGGWKFQESDSNPSSERCQLKPDSGSCKAIFTKYYYDSRTGKCRSFSWGGCGGVVPFDTLEECQAACGG